MLNSKANEFKFESHKEISFEYKNPQLDQVAFHNTSDGLHSYQEGLSLNEEDEEDEKESNDENIDESELIRQYYADTSKLSKDKKYINSSNFNASRSNEQLLSVGNIEEYQQNFQPHQSPLNSEFIKDLYENEPVPEVLTPENPSSKESTQIKLTKVQEKQLSKPKLESQHQSMNESAKFINYELSLEEEKEKESISKDAESLLIFIDEFISDDLTKKQVDLMNIESNISKSASDFLKTVNKTFDSSTENILKTLAGLQVTHNLLIEEKRKFEQRSIELKVRCDLLEIEKKNYDSQMYDLRTSLTKKNELEQELNKTVESLNSEVDFLK